VQFQSPRDLHRLVDAVAEIGPLPGVEPFPVESFDLFGVLLHATREHTSELDRVAQALSSVAESGAEPTLLILGPTGGIRFAQSAGRRLLASYFGRTQPGRAPKALQEWAADATRPDELVVDGAAGRLVVFAPSHERAGSLVVLVYERPWDRPRSHHLTDRELEVLELVDEGMTNAEIAHVLWVAPSTVRKHLENAYAKLGVNSRTEATALVRREAAQTKD
jgi:DNA-binding NarL/FixJ family response regulator